MNRTCIVEFGKISPTNKPADFVHCPQQIQLTHPWLHPCRHRCLHYSPAAQKKNITERPSKTSKHQEMSRIHININENQWPTTKNRNCSTLLSIAHMPRFWFESHPAVSSQGLLAWFTSLLLPKKRYMMMSTFIATRSISTPERSLQNKQLRCSLRMQLTQWKLADVWRLGHCSGSGGTWQQLTTWALAWHSNERRETHE